MSGWPWWATAHGDFKLLWACCQAVNVDSRLRNDIHLVAKVTIINQDQLKSKPPCLQRSICRTDVLERLLVSLKGDFSRSVVLNHFRLFSHLPIKVQSKLDLEAFS